MLRTRPETQLIFSFEVPSLGIETDELAAGTGELVAELWDTALVAMVVATAALLLVLTEPEPEPEPEPPTVKSTQDS